jgi:hypothetical protein
VANKRKCKYCLEYFPPEKIKRFGVGYFCSIEHALQWVKEKQAKDKARKLAREKKAVKEKQVKEKKEFKANDLRHQLKVTQPVFNKWRRLNELKWFKDRGLEPTCISCNKPNMDWCCGHLKTVGSQSALRFDVLNTYLQCNRYCNKGLSGNISGNKNTRGYLQGLRDRFGQERAKEIIEYCEVDRVVDWDCDELIAMRKMFNAEIRELKIYLEM